MISPAPPKSTRVIVLPSRSRDWRLKKSNYGWNLIAAVIEGSAGVSFAEYMQRYVFTPLELDGTTFDEVTRDLPYRAVFYEDTERGVERAPFVDNSYKWAGGGFLSTAEDLAHFGAALLEGNILAPETMELLWTEQRTSNNIPTGYGLGWKLNTNWRGRKICGHTGAAVGGSAAIMIFPESKLVFAMAMNIGNVTNPRPKLHGLIPPPDPTWIAELLLLTHWCAKSGIPFEVIPVLILMLVGVSCWLVWFCRVCTTKN